MRQSHPRDALPDSADQTLEKSDLAAPQGHSALRPADHAINDGGSGLRHTLATRLMEDGTPIEQVADILGHQSVGSTGVYLKSSLGLLAKCALDPDRPAAGPSR